MNVKKILVFVSCLAIIACISVGATLAYLTDTANVKNTFTAGDIVLSMDEAKTNEYGEELTGSDAGRIGNVNGEENAKYANQYKLVPGHEYTKDPIVYVEKDSEPCWVFVKVENGLADIEDKSGTSKTIASQIEENGWKKLADVENVYYCTHGEVKDEKTPYPVFETFKLMGKGLVNGTKPDGYSGTDEFIGDYATKNITVTAYAIQLDGFNDKAEVENAKAAWEAGNSEWNK